MRGSRLTNRQKTMRQLKNTQNITDRTSSVTNSYLRDIHKYPMVSADEEVELALKIKHGGAEAEEARRRLIEANLRFVVTVANQYHQRNMDLSDLISEGNIGLVKAAERFDETRGFKFISYAVWHIRQSIISAISDKGRVVRVPQNQQNLLNLLAHLQMETMQTEQRQPTSEEFAQFADITPEKAAALIALQGKSVSIDTPLSDDSDASIGDMIASDNQTDTDINRESLRTELRELLRQILSTREQEVISRSFGIDRSEQSLDEISLALGLSRERVRQIREKAVNKLRHSKHISLLSQYLG